MHEMSIPIFWENIMNLLSAEFAHMQHTILTHCILIRISNTIYWKSPISILGTSGYEI